MRETLSLAADPNSRSYFGMASFCGVAERAFTLLPAMISKSVAMGSDPDLRLRKTAGCGRSRSHTPTRKFWASEWSHLLTIAATVSSGLSRIL